MTTGCFSLGTGISVHIILVPNFLAPLISVMAIKFASKNCLLETAFSLDRGNSELIEDSEMIKN